MCHLLLSYSKVNSVRLSIKHMIVRTILMLQGLYALKTVFPYLLILYFSLSMWVHALPTYESAVSLPGSDLIHLWPSWVTKIFVP